MRVSAVRKGEKKVTISIEKVYVGTGKSVSLFDPGTYPTIKFEKEDDMLVQIREFLSGPKLTRFESAVLAAVMRTYVSPKKNKKLHFYKK